MKIRLIVRPLFLLLLQSLFVIITTFQNENLLLPDTNLHHLGSKETVHQLSKLDRYLSSKAHRKHLEDLNLLYAIDDVDTDFGREFFSEKKSRTKRGGNKQKNKNNLSDDQNNPDYFALPLAPLPEDVLENLSSAQLFGRPNKNLIRLANELSHQRSVLPPPVNPEASKNPAAPPSDSFEPVPKFPSSIQDIMTDMGINGYPPSDESYPPEYSANPPLKYPAFTHKPTPSTKAPEKYVEKPTTAKPKKKKTVTTKYPKAEQPIIHYPKPEQPIIHYPKPEQPAHYPEPEKPIHYPNSIQDVMNHLGVSQPNYYGHPPTYDIPQPIVYSPPAYKPSTKKPKKKKSSKKPKVTKHKAPSYSPVESPKHEPPKHEPPKYEPPKHEPPKYESPPKTTPATYVHTHPTVVESPEYHTRAPEPFPSYAPAPPAKKNSSPRDPNNYMAVIPYDDVYKLFNMLNKHVSPTKMAKTQKRTTTYLPPPTTKRTEQLRAKVVKKTPDEGYKKKKRKKPKKTVTVSANT
jgi:hypothetical protein